MKSQYLVDHEETAPPVAVGGEMDWEAAAVRLEPLPAEEVITWAAERFGDGLVLSTSLQAGGLVLLDMAHRQDVPVHVLTLDTGRLPEETHQHIDRVRRHYGIEVEVVLPDAAEVESMVRRGGSNLFRHSVEGRQECCRVRKVEPLRRALAPYPAWLSGLRRSQSRGRAGTPKVQLDLALDPNRRRVKVNPLADWDDERLWAYVRRHGVPYHPLYDRGYLSIGCAPCTRPVRPAEEPRAARWWWESEGHRECGLHVLPPEPAAGGAAEGTP